MTHADDKKLTLLLRGGLSESEKAKVMEHIAECDECADRMACLTLDMAAIDPPAGMSEDILAAAARENTREKRRQDNLLMYSVRVVAGICAALVMIFSGAFKHISKRYRYVEAERQEPLDKPIYRRELQRIQTENL